MLKLTRIIWLPQFETKVRTKHGVEPDEVESVLLGQPKILFWERGEVPGEDFYLGLGKTHAGWYLAVFFLLKKAGKVLVISARDMNARERKRYGKK